MRRTYELYINGTLADIATDALVLMNYKQTDATAPAAIFNSWSQSVVLPRTSKNNTIFDHIFRDDHITTSGKFNPLVRTPFVIYSQTGEILESGYLKLTEITETQYSATLYGGLGGFLFGLMYNPDGSKRSLADLVYTIGGDEHEFDFKITRDAVREAWRHVTGLEAHANPWDCINFAPCYNGLPGGDFNSKRAFCSTNCYGVSSSDGEGHSARNGHVLVDLVNNVDEWAANDLRSYQQRPVIAFKAIIDAICNAANNGGYTVNLDADFFKNTNPYYKDLWLTLPKLDEIQLPTESGSGTDNVEAPVTGALPAYDATHIKDTVVHGPWENDARRTTKHDISVTFNPSVGVGGDYEARLGAWQTGNPGEYTLHRLVVMYQLIVYDSDGLIVNASKVAATTTKPLGNGVILEPTVTPKNFVNKYNMPLGTQHDSYYPEFLDFNEAFEDQMYNGDLYQMGSSGDVTPKVLADDGGNVIPVTLHIPDAMDVHRVVLRTTYLAAYTQSGDSYQYHQELITALPYHATPTAAGYTLTDVNFEDGVVSYSYESGGTVHSGASINKAILLGGTQTPADYLLSYLKMFGLYMTYNVANKQVGIMTRKSFYNGGDVNLEGKIDVTTRRSVPFAVASRWYEWSAEVEGRFADYYKDVYNKEYGMARVNTGFEFDASHNDVLKDCIFKGAAEVLHRNKYFVRVSQDSKDVPSPFLDGGKYTLWGGDESAAQHDVITPDDTAVIEYMNATYPGYDNETGPKPEFCDKDGKALEGSDVLLLHDGKTYSGLYDRMTLTDDNGLMTLYNEGTPCYLLGQWTIASNKKFTINASGGDNATHLYLPRFRRMLTGEVYPMVATHSLDMGVPSEIDQPVITCAADKAVYPRGWAAYIDDKMNVDTKVVTCKVNLRGLQVGQDLLRKFYYFGGSIWVLNAIKNHVVGGDDLTECEFIKVKDKTNYTNGQTY